jgi:hypothetical protein
MIARFGDRDWRGRLSRYNPHRENSVLYDEVRHWVDTSLVGTSSFLSPTKTLWTRPLLDELDHCFVQRPDLGEGDFMGKLKAQLSDAQPAAVQLMAELLWFLNLFPSRTSVGKKRSVVQEVWSWSGETLSIDQSALSDAALAGIGSVGTAFNAQRWRELSFFISILRTFKALARVDQLGLLGDGWVAGVTGVRLTGDVFHRVQLSRNTAQYSLLMHICELLFHELMPAPDGATHRFRSIAHDEVRMAALFEEFLRAFYNRELPGYRAASEVMKWDAEVRSTSDVAFLPDMRTDITIRSPDRVVIVDAKYYSHHLAENRFGGSRLRAGHLYQLSAYLAHTATREPDKQIEGFLIYPQTREAAELRYTLLGFPITVATVDLSADWRNVHRRLVGLI